MSLFIEFSTCVFIYSIIFLFLCFIAQYPCTNYPDDASLHSFCYTAVQCRNSGCFVFDLCHNGLGVSDYINPLGSLCNRVGWSTPKTLHVPKTLQHHLHFPRMQFRKIMFISKSRWIKKNGHSNLVLQILQCQREKSKY